MNSTWLKGSLVLATTLCAGIAIGVLAERSHMRGGETNDMHATHGETQEATHMMHSHIMQSLTESLNLDSSQNHSIMQTLHKHQLHIDSAWGTMRPHINATLDSAHAEIMSVLTPEQKETFRKLTSRSHGG